MTVHTAQYSLIKRGKLFNSIVGNIRVRPAVMPNGRLAILLRFVTRISPLVAFSARVSEL